MSTSRGPKTSAKSATAARRRPGRSDGEVTRARVLEAAVECILDVGYYQASSNAIARQADVTWGTIQHQFGTREALLLEVLEAGLATLDRQIETAEVTGTTLEERLHCVFDLLEGYYGRPEHIVHIQILLDLSSDPNTSASARRTLDRHRRTLARLWEPFFVGAMGEAGHNAELSEYAYLTLRGYLTANLLLSRLRTVGRDPAVRALLIRGVACAVTDRARELGLSIDPSTHT